MSLFTPIDIYCERLTAEFLSEPLNAVTNLSFVIAAYLLYKAYRKNNLQHTNIALLIALVLIVGMGSLLFHTFANNLAMLADVIPIMIFVFSYLYIALKTLLNFRNSLACIAIIILFLVSAVTSLIPHELNFNGSASYFPCLIALLFVAGKSKNKLLYIASIVFIISLSFRSVDMVVCNELAMGTHFIWHLLNGLLLYLLVKVLINHCAARRSV